MNFSRLLIYGALGIIAGLLIENRAILTKQIVEKKARRLKKKIAAS